MKNLTDNYIKDWVIPFYQGKISQWELKSQKLIQIYDRFSKPVMESGDQITDFDTNNSQYDMLIQNILLDDLRTATKEMGFDRIPIIQNSWFQIYNKAHSHSIHNHGMGSLSVVCYIKYDSTVHKPTTFISPFLNLEDGNVMEYQPSDVEEGTFVVFPSALAHYVPTNQSDVERMILAFNMK
mgnify:CR=1 FL=1|jgi:hypothetical protein